jgi:hypothetical protein
VKLLGHLHRVTPTQAHAESIAHPVAEKFSSQNYIDSILDILHHRNKRQDGSRIEKDPHHQPKLDKIHDECAKAAG